MKTNILVSDTLYVIGIVFIIILVILVFFLIYKLKKAKAQRREFEEKYNTLEVKVNGLKLETLESKLNPHLFKNILNSIQSHAYQTYHALDKLANVLDYILYESQKKFVSPREEIEFALNLIEINKIKVSPLFELKVKTKIKEAELLYEQPILAPMISIDLIENAFKHADLKSPDAFISIVFEFRDSCFYLTVSNKISDHRTLKKEYSGLGSNTLDQRLKIIYNNNYKLDKFIEDDVYIAHLKIDLLEYKAQMLAAGR
ncbi:MULTISPECIES: sensor histidine kinase [Flavobacterium]|jgi:sensor histidine kinase YesM|uniref:Histidine kinase n=1 Tax=Flavobacterium lindanitolerans TaxID=428988 RepID=A0A497UXT9_9FLAO|nr:MULTISPECIES: histidine kinase [Flavobacterium]MBU7571342.1 histidine kinase [Flavobacterium sp.]PZO34502.1 MAG: histidine kinase [Flavobacteriaceae bacterium]KQS46445.1 histidine kinase [Flavobacterium sp. Leaf359]MBL7868341.1 histidine kinase [Flavobacterium lindanitolerans]MDQ7959251.1 histidine kinase [Flavobacterium lindanitolerans]